RMLLLLILLAVPISAQACLWDRDTLAMEAKKFPEVLQVIMGRFERNPPLYYEMRLKRVAETIARDPVNLDAYDDAGVACDRLGRDDEAIQWMEKKRAQLDKGAGTPDARREHRYRYLANVGTFWAHRWFRKGADRKKIKELE